VFPAHQQQQVRSQLANALQAVVTQELVPGVNGGRIVAAEILIATSAVRNLIRESKTHQVASAMQAGGQHGMQTMDRALADLVRARAVTIDVALERAHNPDDLRRLASGS
jgi:twitching motility protein PilT